MLFFPPLLTILSLAVVARAAGASPVSETLYILGTPHHPATTVHHLVLRHTLLGGTPSSPLHLFDDIALSSFSLSFAMGRWENEEFGGPLGHFPAGFEVTARFKRGAGNWRENWRRLTLGLGGLFCTASSHLEAAGVAVEALADDGHVTVYGRLPRESFCKENLVPFVRLWPCRGRAGLVAALLSDSGRLFSSLYHSLHVAMTRADKGPPGAVDVVQTATVVERSPPTVTIAQNCSVVGGRSSTVRVPWGEPRPAELGASTGAIEVQRAVLTSPARSFSLGAMEFRWRVTNRDEAREAPVRVVDVFPWYLHISFHTLRIIAADDGRHLPIPADAVLSPGQRMGRPALIELPITVPANSSVLITLSFERLFLPWAMYPPDPHRDMELGSTIVVVGSGPGAQRVYSNAVAVPLPMPDFSMPYNAMILTCTVYALMWGSIINVLIRSVAEDDEEAKLPGLLAKLKAKFTKTKTE
jgi:hypothetical protein